MMPHSNRILRSAALVLCLVAAPIVSIPDAAADGLFGRSNSGVPLLLRPLDRLAKGVNRTFRCRCQGLPLLRCPCGQRRSVRGRDRDTAIAEAPVRNSGAQPTIPMPVPIPVDTSIVDASARAADLPRRVLSSAAAPSQAAIEILGKDLTQEDIDELQAVAFRVVAVRQFAFLQTSLTRLAAPPDMTTGTALALARKLRPGRQFEPNDLYLAAHARFQITDAPCGRACKALEMTRWEPQYGRCAMGARIGVIDTAVDESHPVLRRSRLQLLSTRSDDRAPSNSEHGTGIVSLLVGELGGDFAALVPNASVVAVDAFHSSATGDAADVFDLIAALDVLSAREIDVINMSFSGPENRFLRIAVEQIRAKGMVLVAAAGADGRSADTGFPARYPNVVAVSAIGAALEPARGDVQGNHIAYAAPGSGISVALPESRFAFADGSSFATPFVTAAYAMTMRLLNDREQATRLITSGVRDLGAVGRDNTFGWGLVQYTSMPPC
jgi:hypothetical protein